MHTDMIGFADRQLRSDSFDTFTEFEKRFRECSSHIFFCSVTTRIPWRLSRRGCLNSSMKFLSAVATPSSASSRFQGFEYHLPEEAELEQSSALFEEEIGKADVSISLDFFVRPEELPLLEQLRGPLATWLHKLGAAPAAAEQMACRLPDYFLSPPCMKHGGMRRRITPP